MVARLRGEKGFGLIELLMAMVMLNVGILALVASLSSGTRALQRAGKVSTASVLADSQMELYRGLTYCSIEFDPTAWANAKTDTNYIADSAYPGASATAATSCPYASIPSGTTEIPALTSTSCSSAQCLPIQSVTGPDRHRYRIDTYMVLTTPTATTGRPVIRITVVVRDQTDLTHFLARESSIFDQSTGS